MKKRRDNPRERYQGIGRPPALFVNESLLREVATLARVGCTQREAADVLEVARSTFENYLRDIPAMRDAWERGRSKGKAEIRMRQHKNAVQEGSDQMLKWLGKNRLGQSDRVQVQQTSVNLDINANMNLKEAADAYAQAVNGSGDD